MANVTGGMARAREEFDTHVRTIEVIGRTADGPKPFTPFNSLASYWTKGRIIQALGAGPGALNPSTMDLIKQRYLRVFSILVLIGRSQLIHNLIPYAHLDDVHLPFYSVPHQQWPSDTQDLERFKETQWTFCVQDFERQLLMNDPHFDENHILPIEEVKTLNSHGSARISQVTVPQEYNHLINDSYPSDPLGNYFVLKTYFTDDAKKYYYDEVNAFKHLMHQEKYVKNMIMFYGSWRQGNTYNILLEYADQGTLLDFFRSRKPPTKDADIAEFWSNLLGIVTALERIHELRRPGDETHLLQGIHQDIKPENILVVSGAGPSEYDVTFKIADLGLSHFIAKVHPDEHVGAIDRYGTPMYSAPECCRLGSLQQSNILVEPSIDIWSLGCILSEAAVWVVLGEDGLTQYADLRRSQISEAYAAAGYGDCFHDGTDALPAVNTMHRRLRQERRVSDNILGDIIMFIAPMFETNFHLRPPAVHAVKNAQRIVEITKDIQFPSAFRKISGPVVQSIFPPQPHFMSPISSTRPDVPRQTPPQVPIDGFAFPTPLRRTPPQTPTRPGSGPHPIARQWHSLQDHPGNLRDIPEGMIGGLNITHSPPTSPNLMSSEVGTRSIMAPSSPNKRRTSSNGSSGLMSSRVSFAQDNSRSPVVNNQHHSEPEADSHANGYFTSVVSPTYQNNYQVNTNGSQSLHSPSSTSISISHRIKKGQKYESVTIEYALNWKRSNPIPKGFWCPINNILGRLEGRDHVFLIDDSKSMEESWPQVIRVFQALAGIVKHTDNDGIDLYFTSAPSTSVNKTKRKELIRQIEKNKPQAGGECDMKQALAGILERFGAHFDTQSTEKSRGRSRFSMLSPSTLMQGKKKRGLSVYILTDGVWQEGPPPVCGVEQPIRNTISKLNLDTKVGIQFIRFGRDEVGMERLDLLDSRLQEEFPDIKMDIVDTTRHDGNVLKMLLGAFDRHWDDDEIPPALARNASHHSQRPSIYQSGVQNGLQNS